MMLLCGAVGGAFSRSLIWLLHLITGVLPLISDLSLILDLVAREMARKHTAFYTRTRTNTNPNDTEANAAGRSVRACVARKSKS